MVAALTLSACGSWRDSRANPSNWFGKSTPSEPTQVDETNALIPQRGGKGLFDGPEAVDISVPIATVTELRVDPTSTGAILVATGVAARQGAYDAQLRLNSSEEDQKNGVLAFTFRVVYPDYATAQGTERTRTITEAVNLSKQDLEGIRLIRVSAAQNARETRRR